MNMTAVTLPILSIAALALMSVPTPTAEAETTVTDFPTVGAEFYNISPAIQKLVGTKHAKGVVVVKVYPDSPAHKAQLKEGDIITEANGKKQRTFQDVITLIDDKPQHTPIKLKIERQPTPGTSPEIKSLSMSSVATASLKNAQFLEYQQMRKQYKALTDRMNVATQKKDAAALKATAKEVAELMHKTETQARQRGDLLLAAKYADQRQHFAAVSELK